MTARQVFEAVLIEMNKLQAPSMLLEDFNYMFNKAINLFVNSKYNIYNINQQTTDDLRVLTGNVTIYAKGFNPETGTMNSGTNDVTSLESFLQDAKYEFNLPLDYLHLLNCECIYKVTKKYKCYNPGYWKVGATRLTADLAPVILLNLYMKPSYKKPYYYINNSPVIREWDNSELTPVNPVSSSYYNSLEDATPLDKWDTIKQGTDLSGETTLYRNSDNSPKEEEVPGIGKKIVLNNNNLPRYREEYGGELNDLVEKSAGHRYGNASPVRIEIRYGRDTSLFLLVAIHVDYIKAPLHIRLTQELIDLTEDTSQVMEFPDYVCQEIINELVKLVMENSGDPRLNTNPIVSQSIASPVQGLTESKK